MVKRFRNWITKQKERVEHVIETAKELESLVEQVKDLHTKHIITVRAILEIGEQTGGKGWVEAMQIAVKELDDRTAKLSQIAAMHQQAFEEMDLIEFEFDDDADLKDLN